MDGNVTAQPSGDARDSQFSLRTLFYFMSVCCLILALASYAEANWLPAATILTALAFFIAAFFWWNGTYAAIGCCLFAVLLWLPLGHHRQPSLRAYCGSNLKQIALALHNYRDMYGEFPPAVINDATGKPMHSWRVLLLPFLELNTVYDQYDFNEPWDGPNNSRLASLPGGMQFWRCPAETKAGPAWFNTSYVAVVGSETAWPGSTALDLDTVTDGVDKTLCIVEVKNSGIHWMEPRDLNFQSMPLTINAKVPGGLGSNHAKGCNAACCDGSVHFLRDEMPAATLRALLTRDGEEYPKRLLKWHNY